MVTGHDKGVPIDLVLGTARVNLLTEQGMGKSMPFNMITQIVINL
jgi:hypothetical protein